jgi:hypothetical protein
VCGLDNPVLQVPEGGLAQVMHICTYMGGVQMCKTTFPGTQTTP